MTYSTAIKILTIFILLMVIAACAPFLYYKFYPFRPITELNSPFPVNKTVVKAGEEISWTTSFCKTDNTTAKTTIKIATQLQQIDVIKDKEFEGDKGCYTLTRSALIPQDAAAGEATIEFYSDYEYPFGRVISVRGRTVNFQIESDNKTAPVNPIRQSANSRINTPSITQTTPQSQAPVVNQAPNNQPANPTVNTNVSTQITSPNICVPLINLCL